MIFCDFLTFGVPEGFPGGRNGPPLEPHMGPTPPPRGRRLAVVEVVKSPERIAMLLAAARGPPRPRPAVVGQLQLF